MLFLTCYSSRMVKMVVLDWNALKTEDAERRLVSSPGLQAKIDELVKNLQNWHSASLDWCTTRQGEIQHSIPRSFVAGLGVILYPCDPFRSLCAISYFEKDTHQWSPSQWSVRRRPCLGSGHRQHFGHSEGPRVKHRLPHSCIRFPHHNLRQSCTSRTIFMEQCLPISIFFGNFKTYPNSELGSQSRTSEVAATWTFASVSRVFRQ
ncbi:hypothetical protein SCLCIDRAFT_959035 [Scleroderma citrinum Foug A]|uniref:Uncharacterized protein n=1 Tax=Scleroderma citrinum Foug A TaxID=1036808 RepID=A0A0C3AU90_9AGAM|nr:hypothetical protein SCLCIDRAFT_959035 [Scleroderma citrinum Foug A]